MRTRSLLVSSLLVATTFAACAGEPAEQAVDIGDFDAFADGKSDTAYLGTRSAEIQAALTGKVRVAVPGKTAAQLQTMAAAIKANPTDYQYRDITAQVTEQIKYARNALRQSKYTLNLEGGDATYASISVASEALVLDYSVKIESLVKFKELEAQNLKPADLIGQKVDIKLPMTPGGLYERIKGACSSDFDANGAAVPAEDLRADNMFYYWDPNRAGCSLDAADIVTAQYTVSAAAGATTVYPEYDKLIADGKISMVQIYGQIEHGDLSPNDWGFLSINDVTRTLTSHGFRKTQTFPNNTGHRLEKTMPNGLKVEIDMLSPVSFADHVDREASNAKFREAIKSHEVVYYAGHAFYGSLTVLDEPTAYPLDQYQVIFMDACWSYAYYTKQVFRNRATAADPTGFINTDVVNNTEMGITGSEQTAMVLFEKMFAGADLVKGRKAAKNYSWNNLVKYMNAHAKARADARGETNEEIYGVSGVAGNKFKPTR
ncbi:MAG: hypothetical protein KBG15_03500 [Kofleriaceae bacterium]|nr:hypothetical protein [Kofleriaceae bacterium]